MAWLESEAQTLVLLDIRATSGKAPRIISLASGVIDVAGRVTSTFHEYVEVQPPATTSELVHDLSFTELQGEARGDFAAVATRWLEWLRARVAGSSTAALVTAGGVAANVYELLCAELLRHGKALPTTTQWCVLDLLRAARISKAYAKLDASAWPERVPPKGRQVRGGPNITLSNMTLNALRVNPHAGTSAPPGTPRGRRGRGRSTRGGGSNRGGGGGDTGDEVGDGEQGESSPAERLIALCSGELPLASLKMSGVAAADLKSHATGKPVLYKLLPFSRWADKLCKYEADLRDDPVPSGWKEQLTGRAATPPGHDKGPTFTPQDGCSMGGPSQTMRDTVGTLSDPKVPWPLVDALGQQEDGEEGGESEDELDEGEEGAGEEEEEECEEENGEEGDLLVNSRSMEV